MGIPKFFRFTSERYACISEPIIKDAHVCEFDNLYLDMNGIIHMCSHPDNNDPHYRISEEKMYRDIFHYISYLFQIINPKKVFYMAIDGVAPRAKMNQQRCRRFQSAREADEILQKALQKGDKLPDSKRFDSNCITPGTVFMARLHEQLRYFVKHKISTDRAWAKCRVILSGHETPGEGEHKIMDFIRYLRTQPGHDPNTRHCLYGLDADLIMLGFCTHEPNFSILREEVIFKKNASRPSTPDEINFFLLHLSLLRDYIEIEFECLKTTLPFEFDMEKLIDDWVLMGFLVGNDFVPHLPNLMINQNALPLLYDTYKIVLPTLDGYINENGVLNLERFEKYLKQLSEIDKKQFEEVYADCKYFQAKTGRRLTKNDHKSMNHVPDDNETFGVNVEEIKNSKEMKLSGFEKDLQDLIKSTEKMASFIENDDLLECSPSDEDERIYDSEEDMFDAEFLLHKRDYYTNKLDYANVTEDVLRCQAEGYVRAIQWILNYYYQGCCSWSWFYPHHYAPFLSDIVNFKNMEITFDLGKPFKPFEQLLAVLPVASKDLLPEAYHNLMLSESSPIYHYYPAEFETDLNGKIQQWEAVVLIPFIDEIELLSAMKTCEQFLTEEENKRNTHGPSFVYEYTSQNLGDTVSPAYFPTLKNSHANEFQIWNDFFVDPQKVVRGALPNEYREDFFPGVPTLKHIDFTTTLTKAKLKIFEFPSRNDSFILDIRPLPILPSIEGVASRLLGHIVWVGWPYIIEAKVLSVTNDKCKISYTTDCKNDQLENDEVTSVVKENMTDAHCNQWESEKSIFNRHYMTRLGINVGEMNITVHAVNVKGYKYTSGVDGKLVHSVEWCAVPVLYPLQTILTNIKVAPVARPKLYKTIEEAFPVGDTVFVIVGPYYGSEAQIMESNDVANSGRIKINIMKQLEPIINVPYNIAVESYLPLRVAATKCGISSFLFAKITSSVYIIPKNKENTNKQTKNINIGLCLKYARNEKEVMGFTHKVHKTWFYSVRCISLVTDYICRFYEMFKKLERYVNQEDISEEDLFSEAEGNNKLSEVVEWVNSQSFKNFPIRNSSTIGLDPEELIFIHDSIESQINEIKSQSSKIEIKVKPHVLFKSDLRVGNIPPDFSITDFQLFDRVVNVNPQLSVPLGYKGTVVSIIKHEDSSNSVKITDNLNKDPTYLIQFDKSFPHGSTMEGVPGNRFYEMSGFNLLNITAGYLAHNKSNNKVQINVNPSMPTIKNVPLPEKPPVHINNSINNLRPNDGHNSAFANYKNPVKAPSEKPPLKILQRPTPRFEVPPFQINMFSAIASQNQQSKLASAVPSMPPNPIPNNKINNFSTPHQIVNSSKPHQMPNSSKNPLNNEVETEMLRSLLKISDTPKPIKIVSNEKSRVNDHYSTPPNNIQLPFPAKLIDKTPTQKKTANIVDNSFKKTTVFYNSSAKHAVSTPFVPLQVTKKQLTDSQSNYKNDNKPSTFSNDVSGNVNNNKPIQDDVKTQETVRKRANRRRPKSRIAANFDNLNN